MELKIYNGEHFERSQWRYLIFLIVIGAVILGSIMMNNIFGAVIIFAFVGGYIFLLTKTNEETSLKIEKSGLKKGDTVHTRNNFKGFLLEYNTKAQVIKNIVLLHTNKIEIFTIKDGTENLEKFIEELNKHLPILESYEQSWFDKLIRRLQF